MRTSLPFRWLLLGGLWFACLAVVPEVNLIFVCLNAALMLLLFGGRLYAAGSGESSPRRAHRDDEPFVSVHVPTHNEPPEIVALVQFPQAYMNVCVDNDGLVSDYAHYFQVYMNLANRLNSVLSTGTVSMLRVSALDDVGGWSDSTITEDAELGLRLKQGGYRTSYVPRFLAAA